MYTPRAKQAEVLAYRGGWMGVSAVPGSGKTHTLSRLAADLLAANLLRDDQEILIVTLVNSAVDNFSSRVGNFMEEYGLLRDLGYRVRTLHGLAHDIVRERPDLAGLSDSFAIIDDRESNEILQAAVNAWLRSHPEFLADWTAANQNLNANPTLGKRWEDSLVSLCRAYIRQAKDLQLTPQQITDKLALLQAPVPLLELGLTVYQSYQKSLAFRSAVDFDDLIRLALLALKSDDAYLQRLRARWPYVLEDEAQDSSRLQEEIIRLLVGPQGNWVRVGDPNQAIYETFTTASPEFLRNFLREPGVLARDLPDSGRSMPSIIELANELIRWTMEDHPALELRNSLSLPYIRPTLPGDPQPNPPDSPNEVFIYNRKFTPDDEVKAIIASLKRWLPEHLDQTVAILVPRNERGAKVAEEVKAAGMEPVELLQSSQSTRQTAEIMSRVLASLSDPAHSGKMALVYQDIRRELKSGQEGDAFVKKVAGLLRQCKTIEAFLWPRSGDPWLDELRAAGSEEGFIQELEGLRSIMRRWQSATLLPIDQLVLTIAQDLFTTPAELALAHKLAVVLERTARLHPDWSMPQFTEEMRAVAANEHRLSGYSEEETGFDPEQHKGQVVIATIHKAKGLEWDRVYLLSANNYDFPSLQPYDQYISEKYFVRDNLNLEAEVIEKLKALAAGDLSGIYLPEGSATIAARVEYCAERLRLLFVGITRARRSLIMTWNNGRASSGGRENQPAIPFVYLDSYWKEQHGQPAA